MEFSRKQKEFIRFFLVTLFIGVMCALLADALKVLTEKYETHFFELASKNKVLFFVFPFAGFSLIYFLRSYFFKNRVNKGIKEIYNTLKMRQNELPVYKIPSHFVNGLITVVSGGSTGIEVSTVVASASIGSVSHIRSGVHYVYRKELICAGVAAGVTALFNSPIAGALFALEVILLRFSKKSLLAVLIAVSSVFIVNRIIDAEPLFSINVLFWNNYAFPYFIFLGVLAGVISAYLTKSVIAIKAKFLRIKNEFMKIVIGSMIVGSALLLFPQLYGDGYHALRTVFEISDRAVFSMDLILIVLGILFLKPLITAVTLASGGDGGVFAPSMFLGAFTGLLMALLLNYFFNLDVIPLNFMLVGMAAVLSAGLHAPFTAVFLICGLVNDYTLFVPILVASLVSKITVKMIIPYTVYSYTGEKQRT